MPSTLFYSLLVIIILLTFYFHEGGHKLTGIFFKLKPNKIIWRYYFLPIGVDADWPNKWFMLTGIAGALAGNMLLITFLNYLYIISSGDFYRLLYAAAIISIASGIKQKGGDINYFFHFEDLEKYDYNRAMIKK
ncbi:MAG: hypothetical protein O8C63_13315 [Candidatus Methanoperedens sp.]|nr:hypothetical protein [Candidatus Methanoperedens sp.]